MASREVTALAAAKINLALRVGSRRADGYHPLNSLFHAVDLFERVAVGPAGTARDELAVTGLGADLVPSDQSNLALRAAALLRREYGPRPPVRLSIDKAIPVAGGLAGGSADAAAALVALNAWWGLGLGSARLIELAAELGSDVPFAVLGGNAIGQGRGEILRPLPAPGALEWVLVTSAEGLSTPQVFARFDAMSAAIDNSFQLVSDSARRPIKRSAPGAAPGRDSGAATDSASGAGSGTDSRAGVESTADAGPGGGLAPPPIPEELLAGLAAGDPAQIGAALANDLQAAALSLRPDLGHVIGQALAAGALGAVVSGSGPTVACLAASAAEAERLAAALRQRLADSRPPGAVLRATGAAAGATVQPV
jgi:4-diphosphocytidyl-2-C-methyl-D-erythritol kinase